METDGDIYYDTFLCHFNQFKNLKRKVFKKKISVTEFLIEVAISQCKYSQISSDHATVSRMQILRF